MYYTGLRCWSIGLIGHYRWLSYHNVGWSVIDMGGLHNIGYRGIYNHLGGHYAGMGGQGSNQGGYYTDIKCHYEA